MKARQAKISLADYPNGPSFHAGLGRGVREIGASWLVSVGGNGNDQGSSEVGQCYPASTTEGRGWAVSLLSLTE